MNFKIAFFWITCAVFNGFTFGYSQSSNHQKFEKIQGLTLVGPPKEFEGDPVKRVREIGTNYITLVPYGFTRNQSTEIRYNLDRQWWGEKKIGVLETIALAKSNGVSVMLKPQVYMHHSWVGEFDLDTEKEWLEWEKSYYDFIMFYVDLAIDQSVEMICIGTEYKIAIQKREKFWRDLIKEIRCKYNGLLTYSSNWDSYQKVKIWDELDFIGLSSYFPLDEEITPNKKNLLAAWRPIKAKMKRFSKKWNKQILFTEYGYLSVDGCAGKTWELEKRVNKLRINETAQAIAIEALYESFWDDEFWAGGFLWKWFPEMMGHEGYPERDYTPQGKKAEESIRHWFTKNKK